MYSGVLTAFQQEMYYKSLLDKTIYQMLEDKHKEKEKKSSQDAATGLGKRARKKVRYVLHGCSLVPWP